MYNMITINATKWPQPNHQCFVRCMPYLVEVVTDEIRCHLQVLVSGAGSEATAATGGGLPGAGDLAGVSGRGSAELHQPGLAQLRAHQPEPQRPRTLQLRGRSGGLSFSRPRGWIHVATWLHTHASPDRHRANKVPTRLRLQHIDTTNASQVLQRKFSCTEKVVTPPRYTS